MRRTLVSVLLVLMTLSLVLGVSAAVTPHTRFSHMEGRCMYYTGDAMCVVADYNCEGYRNNYVNLGTCEQVGIDYVAPVIREPMAEPTGKCPITVWEGETVRIDWVSSDPDSDIGPQGYLSYEYAGVLDKEGVWETRKGDAGIHKAQAKVYDGEFWDETDLCIEVLKVNSPADLSVRDDEITVYETETVKIDADCTDVDGDKVTITYSGWMNSATKSTSYNDAGDYDVMVKCVDPDGEGESIPVLVHVLNKNRPPQISWVSK